MGTLEGAQVGTGEVGTLNEGTVVRIQVLRDGGRIAAARFKVFGCSAAIASASVVTEWLDGAAVDEVKDLAAERVVEMLQLAPEREHVARMAVEAARRALADVGRRNG